MQRRCSDDEFNYALDIRHGRLPGAAPKSRGPHARIDVADDVVAEPDPTGRMILKTAFG
jgi:hypothetical protein